MPTAGVIVLSFLSEREWDGLFEADEVQVHRRAELPGPVDEEALRREGLAARELMKEMHDEPAIPAT